MKRAFTSRWTILIISLASLLLLGVFDTVTGYEISFSIFYIAPIALASWWTNKKMSRTVAVCAGVVWLLSDLEVGQTFSTPWIPYWNSLVRLVWFWVVASYISEMREKLERERQPNRIDATTGAFNSWAFYHRADKAIKHCHEEQLPLTIAYIDCRIKDPSEIRGRADSVLNSKRAESEWLITIAQTILPRLQGTDTLARLTGSQFALVLPTTNSSAARLKLDTLLDCVSQAILDENYPLQCRVAGVTYSPAPASLGEIIDATDDLLLSIKNSQPGTIKHETISPVLGSSTRSGIVLPETVAIDDSTQDVGQNALPATMTHP